MRTHKHKLGARKLVPILILITLLILAGWIGYAQSHKDSDTGKTQSTSAPASYQEVEKLVSGIATSLPSDFDYIQTPRVVAASLNTNLFGDNTWWIRIPSARTGMLVDFKSPPSGVWESLDPATQSKLDDQAKAVVKSISQKLDNAGYQLEEPPVVGVTNSNDKTGHYIGPSGNCSLTRWHTLPVHIELQCAPAANIEATRTKVEPFITAFATANPSRKLDSVEVDYIKTSTLAGNKQYAIVGIASPDSINTHPTDGSNFFVSINGKWHHLGGSLLCKDSTKVNGPLSALGISDPNATGIIAGFCSSAGA
jgi:hypothetical protein